MIAYQYVLASTVCIGLIGLIGLTSFRFRELMAECALHISQQPFRNKRAQVAVSNLGYYNLLRSRYKEHPMVQYNFL